jgi:hypothetical protein
MQENTYQIIYENQIFCIFSGINFSLPWCISVHVQPVRKIVEHASTKKANEDPISQIERAGGSA